MNRLKRTAARLLAVLALAATATAVVLVVAGASEDGSSSGGEARSEQSDAEQQRRTSKKRYTVKPGDTLSGIAEKTGIEVEELQRLNPDIDPQALASGERLKLR